MEWTPDNMYALRRWIDVDQRTFGAMLGLRRRQTVIEYEQGRCYPSAPVRRIMSILATETGFDLDQDAVRKLAVAQGRRILNV